MTQKIDFTCLKDNIRLDIFLNQVFPDFSRNLWKLLIKKQIVLLNNKPALKKDLVKFSDLVSILEFPEINKNIIPVNLGIKFIYEDHAIVVYNKPKGFPTHPIKENETSTLSNQLLYDFNDLKSIGEGGFKSGLVHRLDNFTSGIIVYAKTDLAYTELRKQFLEKTVYKTYLTIVYGQIKLSGKIIVPLSHKRGSKKRMTSDNQSKTPAKTRFRRVCYNKGLSFVLVRTYSGLMHQIRVHMKIIGHPVLGDKIYKSTKYKDYDLKNSEGHFLHARKLIFTHPVTKKRMLFKVNPPEKFFNNFYTQ